MGQIGRCIKGHPQFQQKHWYISNLNEKKIVFNKLKFLSKSQMVVQDKFTENFKMGKKRQVVQIITE